MLAMYVVPHLGPVEAPSAPHPACDCMCLRCDLCERMPGGLLPMHFGRLPLLLEWTQRTCQGSDWRVCLEVQQCLEVS